MDKNDLCFCCFKLLDFETLLLIKTLHYAPSFFLKQKCSSLSWNTERIISINITGMPARSGPHIGLVL